LEALEAGNNAVFPIVVARRYGFSDGTAACRDQYEENLATNANGGMDPEAYLCECLRRVRTIRFAPDGPLPRRP
jgi:hypothetical protein